MSYKVTEHFKNENEDNIKLNIQRIVAELIISEKISAT